METKRERIMTDAETRRLVREYARKRGIRIPRAYGMLVEKGLKKIGNSDSSHRNAG